MDKLSSIMDLATVAVRGRPLSELLQESLKEAHEQLRERGEDLTQTAGAAGAPTQGSNGAA